VSRGAKLAIGGAAALAFALIVYTWILNLIAGLPVLGVAR